MSVTFISKSIEELCQVRASLANVDCLMFGQSIDPYVYAAVIKRSPLDMTCEDSKSWFHCIHSMIEHEEVYQSIESSALDFSSTFRRVDDVRDNRLDLIGPPVYCSHYDKCRVYIIGPDRELETVGTMGCNGTIWMDYDWARIHYSRFYEERAVLKIAMRNPLVEEGYKGYGILMRADSYASVSKMFRLRKTIPIGKCTGYVGLKKDHKGEMPALFALEKALAAKELELLIPFIMRSSVRTSNLLWLNSLVENLIADNKTRIGILCPEESTKDLLSAYFQMQPNRSRIRISTSSPCGFIVNVDYLIIHQAHSIGLTEAVESINKVNQGGCVILIGDPQMPNLRMRNPAVREACGSILTWFYHRDRYPVYFDEKGPCVAHNPIVYDYDPVIFDLFNRLFYDAKLVNIRSNWTDQIADLQPLTFVPIKGAAVMHGCSPYNQAEVDKCWQYIEKLSGAGIMSNRIGLLTTYCGQKRRISERCQQDHQKVFVGILQDFESMVRDCLIISTVETAERTSGDKRYPFSDLLYDKLCLNLALTRGAKRIVIIGDKDVLLEIDHWKQVLDKCETIFQPEVA